MAYTVVQHTTGKTFSSNLTGGNTAFFVITYASSVTLTQVSGSTNGNYTQAGTYTDTLNPVKIEIWYKSNVTAGAETVTLTGGSLNSGTSVTLWGVVEVSGLGTAPFVDVTATASTSGTLSISINPTGADFILVVAHRNTGATGTLSNLTLLDTLNSDPDYYTTTSASGSITCTDAGVSGVGINAIGFQPAGTTVNPTLSGTMAVTGTQANQLAFEPTLTGLMSLTGSVNPTIVVPNLVTTTRSPGIPWWHILFDTR